MSTKPAPSHGPSSPAPAPAPKPKRALRILCLGDSLTAGYTADGTDFHPYHPALASRLGAAFPSLRVECVEDGLSGDSVSGPAGGYQPRAERQFLARAGGTPFDWAVVLGGTNDVACGFPAQAAYEALRRVWNVALGRGCRVLALTVPETGYTGAAAEADARVRGRINELIRNHKQENFYVFDLNAAVPHLKMSPEERRKYWDDNLHLTPAGYDLMGDKIAAALIDIIMPPGRLQTNDDSGSEQAEQASAE